MKRERLLAVVSVANVIVLLVNILASIYFVSNSSFSRQASESYPLLSKRIFAEDPNDLIINFVSLRDSLRTMLAEYEDRIGLYFEYLPSGVSIGINDRKQVRLASLAKVPTVMATHKIIEQGLLTKDARVLLKEEYRDGQFGSLWKETVGTAVRVDELMRLAIVESDNTAHNALLDIVPDDELDRVYASLDIAYDSREGYPIISSKNYSSILRALFLSSYLSKEASQEILHEMTETVYRDKIPARLPETVSVAHKIGVYETKDVNKSTFSDCGIIYADKRPYMLCMMFDGSNGEAQDVMSEVSRLIYEYVSSVK